MGVVDSNLAELMAIRLVLRLFSGSNLVGKRKLIVESDSKVAVSWVKGSNRVWKYHIMFNEIKKLLKGLGDVVI